METLHFLVQGMCKVGKKGAERHVLLFEKLLLILKKKDAKHYTYKGHILVSPPPSLILHIFFPSLPPYTLSLSSHSIIISL